MPFLRSGDEEWVDLGHKECGRRRNTFPDVAEGWVVEIHQPQADTAVEQGGHNGEGVLGQVEQQGWEG